MQEKILEILRQEGAAPVHKLVKSLGLTYGLAQWHIDRLECPLSAPRRLRGLEARLGRAAQPGGPRRGCRLAPRFTGRQTAPGLTPWAAPGGGPTPGGGGHNLHES